MQNTLAPRRNDTDLPATESIIGSGNSLAFRWDKFSAEANGPLAVISLPLVILLALLIKQGPRRRR